MNIQTHADSEDLFISAGHVGIDMDERCFDAGVLTACAASFELQFFMSLYTTGTQVSYFKPIGLPTYPMYS